jgi:ATP-binding cassette subfamily B protein
VVNADEILVLDQGVVVERGDHQRLLAQDGAYAALWRRQLQDEAEPAASPDSASEDFAAAAESAGLSRELDDAMLRASEI